MKIKKDFWNKDKDYIISKLMKIIYFMFFITLTNSIFFYNNNWFALIINIMISLILLLINISYAKKDEQNGK